MNSKPIASRGGPDRGSTPRSADDTRPFGTHIRMAWWKSLIVIAAIPLTLLLLQLGFYSLAGLVEGGDHSSRRSLRSSCWRPISAPA